MNAVAKSELAQFAAIRDVIRERERQDERFGEQNHLDLPPTFFSVSESAAIRQEAQWLCEYDVRFKQLNWLNILNEEVAEAAEQAACGDLKKLRAELIQVAAVALAWVEAIDRRPKKSAQTRRPCVVST